ncbi:MAG: hypothetical protein HW416_3056 [Chloroflexi bacterium]|nr:hypothetical protein [Chloroflexota bacterium]
MIVLALGTAIACGPPGSDGRRGSQGLADGRSGQAAAPKVLTLAIPRELDAWNADLIRVTRGGGTAVLGYIAHNRLVVQDEHFAWVPELAVEQISVEKGTWRINADNTMDTVWTIHPNVVWHDGAPFTSADLMFTFTVMKDPEVPNTVGAALRIMESASAPDPHTFAIHWVRPYVDAAQAPWLTVMPRHLLEEAYARDKVGLPSHPWMTTDFVGLGPYRVVRWERGSHMEFAPFDRYFKGRPPLDTLVVRFIADDNVMLAALLAGQFDVIPATSFDMGATLDVQSRWEGTRNRIGGSLTGRLVTLEPQHRVDFARPVNGLANLLVRRAAYQAIDRDQLAHVINRGFAPAADSWFFPGHELRPAIDAAIPAFPHDSTAAQQLLREAGWARGAGGTLQVASGESLEVQIATPRLYEREANIVADYWRSAGARVDELVISADRLDDLEGLAKLPGARMATQSHANLMTDRFHSGSIAGPENRWTGRNWSGYANPRLDAVLDRLVATISATDRLPLHRELLREQLGNLVLMPLYWEYNPFFVVGGVTGIRDGGAWNIYEWDRSS